ncbi:hypothetical protein DOA20_23130 [Salmonella enterica subsp. enterica serovar Newport]|nr:hypothetical protein [Salmonella enterica subsp. enterica serovar Newport]
MSSNDRGAKVRGVMTFRTNEELPENTELNAPELRDFIKHRPRKFPVNINPFEPICIRLSPEVVKAFVATGIGWQSRMNAALEDWLKKHDPKDVKL